MLAGCLACGAGIAAAGPAGADPVDPFVVPAPPAPVVTYPVAPVAGGAAMTPRQQTVPPPGPSAGAPPVLSEGGIPEIPNPQYGSGNGGGGIFGTLKDLWTQVKNPAFLPEEIMGGAVPPPGAGAPMAPGAGAPMAPGAGAPMAPSAGTPAPNLPPGYYPLDGPPPPGYEYLPAGPVPPTS